MAHLMNQHFDLLFQDLNLRCFYCNCYMRVTGGGSGRFRTKDHLIPRALGGTNDYDNIVYCCSKCNNKKSNFSLSIFRRIVSQEFGINPDTVKILFPGEIRIKKLLRGLEKANKFQSSITA